MMAHDCAGQYDARDCCRGSRAAHDKGFHRDTGTRLLTACDVGVDKTSTRRSPAYLGVIEQEKAPPHSSEAVWQASCLFKQR
jgi:hypothetical protein